MKYFEFTLISSAKEIEENSRIKLRDYVYDNTIGGVNNFMYKNMKRGIVFLIYKVENENSLSTVFAYDEKTFSFNEAYQYILEMLNNSFCINKIEKFPVEITMFKCYEYIRESNRKDFITHTSKLLDATNLFLIDYVCGSNQLWGYDLEEKIVSNDIPKSTYIYDKDFQKELRNISNHKNNSNFSGNMVHYIISARSSEAAYDMVKVLVQSLANANRLKSRRIEIINNIESDFYRGKNHLEDIIENNYGGTVVIDLTEKFGFDPVDYTITCEYIEKLIKKHRNNCLFIFTYNINQPGFSYFLLPKLSKYLIPISLREGTMNRKSAIKYLETLITNSEFSSFSYLAKEFLEQFAGNNFTQTDVLQFYEQFDAWCLNKTMLNAYDHNLSSNFMMDRDSNTVSHYDKLQNLIGLNSVKKQIDDVITTNTVEKERKKRQANNYRSGCMHMIFSGNPGTAKTTVAKLFAGIAKETEILKSGSFVERGGMDLDGIGCVRRIREAFTAAKGGVLFIDEAYSLQSSTAITVLLQEMENHREDVIVILAGYSEKMQDFLELNEGLKSRIPYWIDFPDYSTDELTDIFNLMIKEKGLSATDDAIKAAHYIFEKIRFQENFGNGRYVRNLIEHAIQNQSVRLLTTKGTVDSIKNKELFLITKDDIHTLDEGLLDERAPGTAQRELDEMIGLTTVKSVIQKAKASFVLKKLYMERGLTKTNASLHMVFTGNPGTAKTTVARLFAEIMKDERVLPTGEFVEVGRADLVGEHVGGTAPKVRKKFKEANGGVLFIDEAYSLCDGYENSFGDEAITTIVQEMENHRDSVIVIFAGYPAQMKQFLDRNPGLSSRIAFHVNFEDYTVDELCDITMLMLSRKQLTITPDAMSQLRKHYANARNSVDYGNGRFVRKLLEEAEMNLAERLLQLDKSEITEQLLTTIERCDIPNLQEHKIEKKNPIGFIA